MGQRKINKTNFQAGDYWISRDRRIFLIVEILEDEFSHFPITVEEITTGKRAVASRFGVFSVLSPFQGDRIVMQVSNDYYFIKALLAPT